MHASATPALRRGPVLLCAALALLLGACAAPRSLSQAQDAFSAAAQMENQSALQQSTAPVPVPARTLALGRYREADTLLGELLRPGPAQDALRKDQLYGNAVVLRALTAWRIQALTAQANAAQAPDPGGAVARCTAARDETGGAFTALANLGPDAALGPRDAFLVGILPALRENSWSHCIVSTRAIEVDDAQNAVHDRQRQAFDIIETQLGRASGAGGAAAAGGEASGLMLDASAVRYARFAQMQILVNWWQVLRRAGSTDERDACAAAFIDGRLRQARNGLGPQVTDPAERTVLAGQLAELGQTSLLDRPQSPPAPAPAGARCRFN